MSSSQGKNSDESACEHEKIHFHPHPKIKVKTLEDKVLPSLLAKLAELDGVPLGSLGTVKNIRSPWGKNFTVLTFDSSASCAAVLGGLGRHWDEVKGDTFGEKCLFRAHPPPGEARVSKHTASGEERFKRVLEPDDVRDIITPLWKQYIERSTGPLPNYYLFKKSVSWQRKSLLKTVKGVRRPYQERIEERNKLMRKARQSGKLVDGMSDADIDAKFGKKTEYPGWTEKDSRNVEWCYKNRSTTHSGKGTILPSPSELFYRNKCEFTMKNNFEVVTESSGENDGKTTKRATANKEVSSFTYFKAREHAQCFFQKTKKGCVELGSEARRADAAGTSLQLFAHHPTRTLFCFVLFCFRLRFSGQAFDWLPSLWLGRRSVPL